LISFGRLYIFRLELIISGGPFKYLHENSVRFLQCPVPPSHATEHVGCCISHTGGRLCLHDNGYNLRFLSYYTCLVLNSMRRCRFRSGQHSAMLLTLARRFRGQGPGSVARSPPCRPVQWRSNRFYALMRSYGPGVSACTPLFARDARPGRMSTALLVSRLIHYAIEIAANEQNVCMLAPPGSLGSCDNRVVIAAVLARGGTGSLSKGVIDDFNVNGVVWHCDGHVSADCGVGACDIGPGWTSGGVVPSGYGGPGRCGVGHLDLETLAGESARAERIGRPSPAE
jgi:hypothetical protein